MSFNDDEQIDASQDSGPIPPAFVPGRVQLRGINNVKVPLEESKLRVMLEFTGGDSNDYRPGLDLVAVLDVSGSMYGEKIAKAKTAMQFVIKKLSPIDRLSVVTFSDQAKRLCPLRQMTENSQRELEKKINDLTADGGTNMQVGVETGLKVLNERNLSGGRVVGIILLSDGEDGPGSDAARVPVGNVPVHTFGFGKNHEPKVLQAIAANSMGGTFSEVQNTDQLSIAFSQCLAGLLTVAVQDLRLKVTRYEDESTIEQVVAGSYPQSKDDAAGSVIITFGDLYSKEVRRIIVDLLLPATSQERAANVLKITYSYSIGGKQFNAKPATLTVRRTGKSAEQQERPEVITEDTRLRTARMIREARVMADGKNVDNARDKLVEARNSLKDVVHDSNMLIDMLRSELQHHLNLMKSQELYEEQGRPFALSSEISHDRQRFATRGDGGDDDVGSLRLFATPRMDKYLEQAKSFDKDPSKPLPSVDEDVKEEEVLLPWVDVKEEVLLPSVDEDVKEELLPPSVDEDVKEEVLLRSVGADVKEEVRAVHPLARIARAVRFYIKKAFKCLQQLKKLLNRTCCQSDCRHRWSC